MIYETQGEDKIRVEIIPLIGGEEKPGFAIESQKVEMTCEYDDYLNHFGHIMHRKKTKTIITIFHTEELNGRT
jgi:hypothetical protein